MPPEGFRTITVKEAFYDFLENLAKGENKSIAEFLEDRIRMPKEVASG